MKCKQSVAYIRPELLEKVRHALQRKNVPGLSSSEVRGYGEYSDLNSPDWMDGHIRLELFVPASRAEAIAKLIFKQAHTGLAGDGIVAVQPVDTLYHIRSEQVDNISVLD